MRRFFLIYLFLFPSLILIGQNNLIKANILSKEFHKLIPFATVQVVNSKKITDTDEKGYFEISANQEDSLLVTCIGFKDLVVPVSYFEKNASIFLDENYRKMDELIIKNPIIHTFGIVNDKMGSSRTGGSEAERSELTTLIEIPKSIEFYRIDKIFIKAKRFTEENPIRLHIYAVNENGLPGEELLRKSVIITKQFFNRKSNIITIDVKDQNITLENTSFFVGVQWITSTKVKLFTGPEIVQTFKVSEVLSYYRPCPDGNGKGFKNYWYSDYFTNGVLVFVDGKLPPIGKILKKGNPLNMCASAEIEEFSN